MTLVIIIFCFSTYDTEIYFREMFTKRRFLLLKIITGLLGFLYSDSEMSISFILTGKLYDSA